MYFENTLNDKKEKLNSVLKNANSTSRQKTRAKNELKRAENQYERALDNYTFAKSVMSSLKDVNSKWYDFIDNFKAKNDNGKYEPVLFTIKGTRDPIYHPNGGTTNETGSNQRVEGRKIPNLEITLDMRNYGNTKIQMEKDNIVKNRLEVTAHSVGHWWLGLNNLPAESRGTGEQNANAYATYVMQKMQAYEIHSESKYSK